MRKNIANLLTTFRILCSLLLLFLPAHSLPFYVAYLLCGASDMVDGMIARKTNSSSEFGARLDTAADLVFAATALIKLLPALHLPTWIWAWILFIALIKTGSIAAGFIAGRKFVAFHTPANKLTGLLLFFLPLTLRFIPPVYSSAAVCAIATCSAVQEAFLISAGRDTV